MNKWISHFPFKISHVLTDNGLEFTNRYLKSKTGEPCKKPSRLDLVCKAHQVEHRLTKPFTPKTNGMVEKANDILKKATVKQNQYTTLAELKSDLERFLVYYNLYRRHGSLRRELNVRTPLDAVVKWSERKPELFKGTPLEFKTKILSLQINKQVHKGQQPCET